MRGAVEKPHYGAIFVNSSFPYSLPYSPGPGFLLSIIYLLSFLSLPNLPLSRILLRGVFHIHIILISRHILPRSRLIGLRRSQMFFTIEPKTWLISEHILRCYFQRKRQICSRALSLHPTYQATGHTAVSEGVY